VLSALIESYIALRRTLGCSYERPARCLRRFAAFATQRGENHVRAQTAIEWSRLAGSQQERDRCLKTIARFARHAVAEDPRHEVPRNDLFAYRRQRPTPYIFSPEDIHRLVQEGYRLRPRGTLRPLAFATLFALLAATGLRIGEALRLRLTDVTLDGLQIRHTKFRKSRLVPLHETAAAGLARYLAVRQNPGAQDFVFVDHRGRGLRPDSVRSVFRRLVRKLGLVRGPEQPRPHVHSLRHSFAVRSLESCSHDSASVQRHMVALSTYLGHSAVAHTYWYLEATPQLLGTICRAYEDYCQGASR
jgi:integrase